MQRPLLAATGFALCATMAAGCADLGRVSAFRLPPVNPESPVAGQVQAAANRDYAYPSFRDVPSKPKDLPPPARSKTVVTNLVQTRTAQEGWLATHPAMSSGSQAFAAETQAQLPAFVHEAPPADQAARSEAAAALLRAAAEPPPQMAPPPPVVMPSLPSYLPAPAHEPPLPPARPKPKAPKRLKMPPPPASAPRKQTG